MEFVRPGFPDEVDDGFVGEVCGGGEDAGWLMEEDVARGVCLEGFPGGDEVIEFSERCGSIGDEFAVEEDMAVFQKLLRVAFSKTGAFCDELGDGHGRGI